MLAHYGHLKDIILGLEGNFPIAEELVGMYEHKACAIPTWMVKVDYQKKHDYGLVHLSVQFFGNLCQFYVGAQYSTLM